MLSTLSVPSCFLGADLQGNFSLRAHLSLEFAPLLHIAAFIFERIWCPVTKLLTLQVKLGGKKLLLILYGTLLLLN